MSSGVRDFWNLTRPQVAFEFDGLEPEISGAAYELFLAAHSAGLGPRLTSGRRTAGQQLHLWKNYLAGQSRFPALPPGLSPHEYGIAFDMVTADLDDLGDVGYTWETWGGEWGGTNDPIHFQIPGSQRYILKHASLSALANGIDFALMFLPGKVGSALTAAGLAQLYPPWSHSALLEALSSPASTLLDALRQKGLA